ncbi:MAG: hypothetical protein AAB562_03350 [Patescibacteria group bacterium]
MYNLVKIAQRAGAAGVLTLALSGVAIAAETMPQSLSVNPQGHVVMQNVELTSVSGDTLKVKVWGIEWTVATSGETRFLSRGGDRMTVSDLKVGDLLRVLCQTSAETPLACKARAVHDRSAKIQRRSVSGSISSIAAPDTIVIKTERGEVKVKTTAETKIVIGGEMKTFADLTVGMRASARGIFDARTEVLTATHVDVRKPKAEKPERRENKEKDKEKDKDENTNSSATGTGQ